MTDPLRLRFTVACPPAHAFEVWTERFSQWWPPGHSRSGDPDATATFEARPGGRIFERTPTGEELDWGEVLDFDPPRRLRYLWHIWGEREEATEVEVSFAPDGDATAVTIVHSGFERLGERGAALRERNESGWAGLLRHYAGATEHP